jgi:ABC-2 type transport system ATP-binding protein
MSAIVAHHLTKTYRTYRRDAGLRGALAGLLRRETIETRAVDDISFTIAPGEIVGFLGPSGGGATVLGHTPARREPDYLRRISLVMGQKSMLWWDIPAMETLLLHRDMYRIPEPEFSRTVAELAEMLEVASLLGVPVRKLSLGERMKTELLAALVHRPAVLFLDEPTIGLDVVSQQRVRDFLRDLNRERGTTILLTSHYMDDIEALCRRVLLIDHGRLQFDGQLSELVARTAPYRIVSVVFAEPPGEEALLGVAPGAERRESDDPRRVRLAVPRAETAETAGRLLRLGRVVDLEIEEAPVEEIIRAVFRAPAAEGVAR